MPFAEHFMISGLTTAAQTAVLPASININCGFLPTRVEIINVTEFGVLASGLKLTQNIYWDSSSLQTRVLFLNAAGTAIQPGVVAPNGITLYDGTKSVLLGPTIAGTSIQKTNPAIVTTTNPHNLQSGDQVIMSGLTNMKQLGGLVFTITVTGATTFTININTNVANFTAEAVGFIIRKVVVGPLFYPTDVAITAISNANPMVVFTAAFHGLTVGQKVRIRVPAVFGMVEANNLTGVITAVPTPVSFVLGAIDSTAFTPFVWPLGGAAFAAFSPPQVVPIGSGPSQVLTPPFWFDDKLDDAETNIQFQGFSIGTGILQQASAAALPNGVGINPGDILAWTAWRGDV